MLESKASAITVAEKSKADEIKEIAGRLSEREQERLFMLAKCLELVGIDRAPDFASGSAPTAVTQTSA
jgi:hypothetical protein